MTKQSTLVLSMPPYEFSTRTRKAAHSYRSTGPVCFLAPQGVGRTGKRGEPGHSARSGVSVQHVPVRSPKTDPGRRSQLVNLVRSYAPALMRMAWAVVRTPADVVHVCGLPLLPLGLLHRRVHGSRLVMDVNERPASVAASGSLFAAVARLEPALLRLVNRAATVTTVVSPGHADILRRRHGFSEVVVVRNAPLASWRAGWEPPPPRDSDQTLRVVTVGTLFEGRGFEVLIDAIALARGADVPVILDVFGGGRADYEAALHARARDRGVSEYVRFAGRIDSAWVSATYLSGHLGLALYESGDAGNDSLSNKILECVSSGRPVIAGDLPENRAFVTANQVGWLCSVTAEGIADALAEAAGSDIEGLAAHCREVGDRDLTWESEFASALDVVAARNSVKERL